MRIDNDRVDGELGSSVDHANGVKGQGVSARGFSGLCSRRCLGACEQQKRGV